MIKTFFSNLSASPTKKISGTHANLGTAILGFAFSVSMLLSPTFSVAEDIEMFTEICTGTGTVGSAIDPIVLFLFDDSHTMKYNSSSLPNPPGSNVKRWSAVEDIFEATIDTVPNAKVGILFMGNNDRRAFLIPPGETDPEVGMSWVAYPATKPSDPDYMDASKTAAEAMTRIINYNDPEEEEPIADLIYEAYLYLSGGPVGATKRASWDDMLSHPNSYTGGVSSKPECYGKSHNTNHYGPSADYCRDEQILGSPVYKSPIEHPDTPVHIVLFSDGPPNSNYAKEEMAALMGISVADCTNDATGLSYANGRYQVSCISTFMDWLATADLSPLPGTQSAKFHTIGINSPGANDASRFYSDYKAWLESLAGPSGGEALMAENYDELLNAFETIIVKTDIEGSVEVPKNVISFSSGAFSVNTSDIFTNDTDVYFNVFEVGSGANWNGNLKKYALKGIPSVPGDASSKKILRIVDSQDNLVFDEATGKFNANSRSFWTPAGETDGADVSLGGAASQLPASPMSRKIYSNIQGATTNLKILNANSPNPGHFSPGITPAKIAEYMDWLHGDDGTGAQSHFMGSSMHSNPLVLSYNAEGTRKTVFFSTNQGLMHAINAQTGAERYAFMPAELLPNLEVLSQTPDPADDLLYGLDGPSTLWVENVAPLDTINHHDTALLYQTMRRGGRSIYALDVSRRNSLKLEWYITGGSTSGFDKLGQTWSKPIKAKIRFNGDDENGTDVLIFAGGYDPDQDTDPFIRQCDDMGNAIYIVNAKTGDLLWSVSNSGGTINNSRMCYSIPAAVSVLDVDFDGFIDQFYVGDLGGQLWRFDIAHESPLSSLITGDVIDIVGVDGNSTLNRRYFEQADVLITERFGEIQVGVIAGTGARSYPKDDMTQDRLVAVFSPHVFSRPTATDYTALRTASSMASDGVSPIPATAKKWHIDFPELGEKMISKSVTLNNAVIFNTYLPYHGTPTCDTGLYFKQWVVSLETGLSASPPAVPGGPTPARSRMIDGSMFVPDTPNFVMTVDGVGMFRGFSPLEEGDDLTIPTLYPTNPVSNKTINGFTEGYRSIKK